MQTAASLDAVMCALINGIQWRLRKHVCTPEELDIYMSACEQVSRDQFYQVQETPDFDRVGSVISSGEVPSKLRFLKIRRRAPAFSLTDQGFRAPTVIFLHALMSANDLGYRRTCGTVESSRLECRADALALSLFPGTARLF